ncbi:MAG: ECF-type sigma factor [Gemmatimonadales bacterium]|jgi:RNA polymerase sigma factor (TIGR02999 family)
MAKSRGDVTRLLAAVEAGDSGALERLLPLVYDELRHLAEIQLRRERAGHTLQPTALVHEAYMKLAGGDLSISDRAHFLAIAARAMRQALVDHARRRDRAKRGGGLRPVTLTGGSWSETLDLDELLALDAALEELEPRQRQVVEGRFFGGMTEEEVATVLGVTRRTVRRDWVKARAWLYRRLYE